MNIEYVSQDEIEEHEAAMQRVVKHVKEKQEAIDDTKKKSIKKANDTMKAAIKTAEERMRRAIEAARRAADEAIKTAKKEADEVTKAAEAIAEQKELHLKQVKESRLADMQRDFERLSLLRQVYHEAPDDVLELIVSECSERKGFGSLNALRRTNRRLRRVVESCTTKFTHTSENGPDSLPYDLDQRCRRIVEIRCDSRNLRSLEGCPDGLKELLIRSVPHLSDLSPLVSCSMMKSLRIEDSSITDISVVSSMSLLERLVCRKAQRPSVKDLSPLKSCPKLMNLDLIGNMELEDLSSLSACTALKDLSIDRCPVTSLAPLSALINLEVLSCSDCTLTTSLAPLSTLKNLKKLFCHSIGPQTSLLPLESCTGLKELVCSNNASDLSELKRRRPDLKVSTNRELSYFKGYFGG